MKLPRMTQAFTAGLALLGPGVVADSVDAQSALSAFLSANPISTRSASEPKATVDLETLKAAVVAGNYTPSRSWEFLRAACPGSCTDLGLDSSAWPVYSGVHRLSLCDETMLLQFSLYTTVNQSQSRVGLRGCTADLVADTAAQTGSTSCQIPTNMTSVVSSLQISRDTASSAASSDSDAVAALTQLLAYETLNPSAACNETINFALAGQTTVGLYMGSSLHSQNLLAPILESLIEEIQDKGVTETLMVQLCSSQHSARYAFGVIVSASEDLSVAQTAVQTWRNSSCIATLDDSTIWQNLTYSIPTVSHARTNTTSLWARQRYAPSQLRSRDDDDDDDSTTCTAVQVVSGDTCATLATECGITATELSTYNPSSTLCSNLTVGEYICCTEGSAPDYAPSPDADGYCYSYLIQTGDSCDVLAATYTLTKDEIESYNTETWGWLGCGDLLVGEYMCLSSGYPPMPAVIANAVCGPQVNGTVSVPYGTNLSTLNECPLNACCDIWGQCGITAEFCTPTESTTGNPGTAANNTNGCISNCGTEIVQSDAPSEVFKIGYFEGYDVERACMRTMIADIDTSLYTHIHMSFATLNADLSYNISSLEDQWNDFVELDGVKRIITVGGWDFSTDADTYDIFRSAVSDSTNRATLITNTIDLLTTYDLDGVDWDWEYPAEPDIPDIPADSTDDGTNFFLFLLELQMQMAIDAPDKTISTTAPSSFWYLKGIPIMAISEVVDYIVLMAYDLHGQWDWNNTYADPGCPQGGCLRSHVNLTETVSALSMITKAGVPSNMVAVGVASYARSFQMTEADCYGPECTFTGPDSGAVPGACTDTAGYISNAELAGIAEEEEVYTYIDEDSNSNIMVWNDTQWAGYMDDDIKASRAELYEGYNFLGIADWAIDLLTSNGSTSTSEGSSCEVYIDPSIWDEDSPSVTAVPGCSLIWPPQPLSSTTTITLPPWTTTLTYTTVVTETTSASSGGDVTAVTSHVSYWFPTIISIPPVQTTAIPVWGVNLPNGSTTGTIWLTSSVEPSPFAITWTPTIGGTTVVSAATTTATETSNVVVWGDYTYVEPAVTETLGGSTTVISGTILPPVTTTVTPVVYPSTTDTTHDTKLNSKTTKWTSGKPPSPTATAGCAGCGTGCVLFCDSDCPICPIGVDITGGGSGDGDDDDDSSTTTTCSSTTTTSNCDVYCTIATESAIATTDCTSTTCYSVTGCDMTATTKTFTSETTAACPAVATGADLALNYDSFSGCQACAWHFIPFYGDDDASYEDDWPMLAESEYAWPSIDLRRRGVAADLPRMTGTGTGTVMMPTSTARATATVTGLRRTEPASAKMTTAPARAPGAHGKFIEKRDGAKRETIKSVGKCALGADTTVTVPPYTNGYDWYNSETDGLIVGSQTDMPRWYHTTTAAGCAVEVTQVAVADLPTDFGDVATMDHAWEMGWLKDFFSQMFTGATTSTFSCADAEVIFFGCGNRLQSIYSAIASDDYFEFIGISKVLNRLKAAIAKKDYGGKTFKNWTNTKGVGAIKATTPWVGTAETNALQSMGARTKFRSKMELLWQMAASCVVITDTNVNDYMQSTNARIYNKMLALDNWISANLDSTYSDTDTKKFAVQFTNFMNTYSTVTTTVQGYIDTLITVMDAESALLTTIAGNSGLTNALDEANDMLTGYAALKSKYSSVCSTSITWDFTADANPALKRRDDDDDTETTAAACTISSSPTTTASASASSDPLCVIGEDPDAGISGAFCVCTGAASNIPTMTGSNPCGYTVLPTSTSTNKYPYTFTDSLGDQIACASTTKKVSDGTTVTSCAGASTTVSIDYANNPYPYTFTDFFSDVIACESTTIYDVAGYELTECAGSSTTLVTATTTETEVITTTALSDLCVTGNYYSCVTFLFNFRIASCPGTPKARAECMEDASSDVQIECEKLCVMTTGTTTKTVTTAAAP